MFTLTSRTMSRNAAVGAVATPARTVPSNKSLARNWRIGLSAQANVVLLAPARVRLPTTLICGHFRLCEAFQTSSQPPGPSPHIKLN